jgi:hypothetical protein
MDDQEIHSVAAADVSQAQPLGRALLALNNAHARELSWLEPERLEYLVSVALLARRIGELDAFLLAFDQATSYDSPNFQWFRARYPRFVYVDRIWSLRQRADVAVLGAFMTTCSNTQFAWGAIAWSARSTKTRRTRHPTLFMPHWVSPRSALQTFMMAGGRCGICREI